MTVVGLFYRELLCWRVCGLEGWLLGLCVADGVSRIQCGNCAYKIWNVVVCKRMLDFCKLSFLANDCCCNLNCTYSDYNVSWLEWPHNSTIKQNKNDFKN